MQIQIVAILAGLVALYGVFLLHRYATKRLWKPVFEEQAENLEDGDSTPDRDQFPPR